MKDKQIIRGDVWNDCSVKKAASQAKNRIFCVAYVTQADFNGKKTMNRYCVSDDDFNMMAKFLSSQKK